MFNRKSFASGAAAAALVSALGLAYAQTSVDSMSPATPESSQSDVTSMPTYSSSDSTSSPASPSPGYSADTTAPSPAIESLDSESDSEPAPQADRN